MQIAIPNQALVEKWLLKQFPDIIAAYLFGSHARNEARPSSDVDIAIYVPRKIPPYELWEISQDLAITLGCNVDLVNLLSAKTVFQYQIISTGKLLISKNDMQRVTFESFVLRSYFDFNITRQQLIKDFVDRRTANG